MPSSTMRNRHFISNSIISVTINGTKQRLKNVNSCHFGWKQGTHYRISSFIYIQTLKSAIVKRQTCLSNCKLGKNLDLIYNQYVPNKCGKNDSFLSEIPKLNIIFDDVFLMWINVQLWAAATDPSVLSHERQHQHWIVLSVWRSKRDACMVPDRLPSQAWHLSLAEVKVSLRPMMWTDNSKTLSKWHVEVPLHTEYFTTYPVMKNTS